MGFFSAKYVTSVGTTVSRVIEDKLLPDSITSGAMKALVMDEDIPEMVQEELMTSIGLKAERMYNYGKTGYVYGLPSGQFATPADGEEVVEQVLNSIYGPGTLQYTFYAPPNMYHIGWLKLVNNYQYNSVLNEIQLLSNVKGYRVFLDDMILHVPAATYDLLTPTALEQWGNPATFGSSPTRKDTINLGNLRIATPIVRDPLASTTHVVIKYSWEEPDGHEITEIEPEILLLKEETLEIIIDGYDENKDYFHAEYLIGGLQSVFWMYQSGNGLHPSLDEVFNKPVEPNGQFFPFAYFRFNKVADDLDKTSFSYRSSKKLLNYLDISYSEVAEGINSNPDIADVEQAMLIMAVPAISTNELELKYLFAFFNNVFESGLNTNYSYLNYKEKSELSAIVIQDKRFKMVLNNNGISKHRTAGSIGKVGTFNMSQEVITVPPVLVDLFVPNINSNPNNRPVNSVAATYKVHVYRHQISFGIYEEIKVKDLNMVYYIYGGYTTTGDEGDPILLIPLDRSITHNYNIPEREVLYSRSMHYVFNSRVTTKVKWYQTGFFRFLMIVVAVVSMYFGLGPQVYALYAAAATGSSALLILAIKALLFKLLVGFVASYALKIVAKAMGVEAAFIISLIILAYDFGKSAVTGMSIGSTAVPGAPWAGSLLNLATGLLKASQDVLKDLIKDLSIEFNSLSITQKEAQKDLDRAKALLDTDVRMSPFVIFGEKPDDYFNRTIHSGNIGLISITAISSYVDIALTLPKINDTLGGNTYGYA